ncbi:ribonuclease E/G [Anaerococcus porci]|uniref:ribonuclease E/G n=1 Tax=Anaerococcus porci TaxID=2652269 RepID=UPI002A74CC7B|nr:ribonuclease E/G [Anaerococcus porci]MDY3006210.1 ribonuclease E/G [Anaerococcus porci]
MTDYIFIDDKNKAFGKVVEDKLYELNFYNPELYNIYRARVVGRIDSINAYFLLYDKDKRGFLKTKKSFKIGDSIIVQLVKEGFDDKLPTMSANFRIENEEYYLYRFKNKGYPKLKKNRFYNKKSYNDLINLRDKIIREENFTPSPKLILSQNELDFYIEENKELELAKVDIVNDKLFKESLKSVRKDKLYRGNLSIIINELETLTVIDVNSSKKNSTLNESDFFYQINKSILEFIFYNIKLRNIGGMVIIDFLRSSRNDNLINLVKETIVKFFENYEIFGFTKMGLFELSIERKGERLKDKLKKRGYLK